MNTKWYLGARDEEAKKARAAVVRGSRPGLEVLRDILQFELDSLERRQESPANYESPAWAAKQADYLAERRTLKSLIDLLTLDQEDMQ